MAEGNLPALEKRAYREWDGNVRLVRGVGKRAWKARLQGMGWEVRARPWGGKRSETIRIRLISS